MLHGHNKRKGKKLGSGDLPPGSPNLIRASKANDADAVRAALKGVPDSINGQEERSGMTAVHWASANRNLEIAEILFSHEGQKLDLGIRDYFGRLSIDLAIASGHDGIIDLHHRAMFPENQREFDEFDEAENIRPMRSSADDETYEP
ncbi:MAG: ankyrin repeat domain-containing protein [Pseudomonadota bacterium]